MKGIRRVTNSLIGRIVRIMIATNLEATEIEDKTDVRLTETGDTFNHQRNIYISCSHE